MIAPRRNLPSWYWFLAFLVFPAGPYICLYWSGALTRKAGILLAIFSQLLFQMLTFGMMLTEGNHTLQPWVLLNLLQLMMMIAGHHYLLGQRLHLWPRKKLKTWRTMAWMACGMYVLTLTCTLVRTARPEWFMD